MVFLKKDDCKMKCHGSTTVGERGQVVLPAEARKLFGIEPGDKLIVLGADNAGFQRIVLMKSEAVTKMFAHLIDVENVLKPGNEKRLKEMSEEGLKKMKKALKSKAVKDLAKEGAKAKKRV